MLLYMDHQLLRFDSLFYKSYNINHHFTGHPKFIGNIDDIIKYFSNYKQIPYKLQKKYIY